MGVSSEKLNFDSSFALIGKRLHGRRRTIPYRQRVSGTDEVARDGCTHLAQADKSNLHRVIPFESGLLNLAF